MRCSMSWNLPSDWGNFYDKCTECGKTFHKSEHFQCPNDDCFEDSEEESEDCWEVDWYIGEQFMPKQFSAFDEARDFILDEDLKNNNNNKLTIYDPEGEIVLFETGLPWWSDQVEE